MKWPSEIDRLKEAGLWCFVHNVTFDPDAGCQRCRADQEDPKSQLSQLQAAVERYLDKPGCNIPSRQTAMERLRHALERSGHRS